MRPALVLYLSTARAQWWKEHLQSLLPNIECRLWDDSGDPDDVLYAVVWRPPDGWLRGFSNLRCIFSIGAGIDHILEDTDLPAGVPIVRTTGTDLTQRMREYVCLHVLKLHRRSAETEAAQREKRWHNRIVPVAQERTVGIMGLGNLGRASADALCSLGFKVSAWTRHKRTVAGIDCYAGDAEFSAFLADTEILVCLLPLTTATENILKAELFSQLPPGASIINVGRGAHLDETDLLHALDSGQLSHATLDVFRQEPLPEAHPFWQHPNITITPHVASMIDPESGGKEIAANLQRFINGEPIEDLTDPARGY